MAKTKLLFDVDTGIDDSLALLYALRHPNADVVAIGTVAGNVGVDKCTENSLKVVKLVGRSDLPVARGCVRPLMQPLHDAAYVHGNDGLGNSGLPASGLQPTGEHAVEQMVRLARANPGEITLVAVGPMTNVAVALSREPDLPSLFKNVVIMGGAFTHPGNTSPLAEFNIWVDPEAARIVFEAGFKLTIAPLDASMQTLLTDEHIARIGPGPIGTFIRTVTNAAMERSLQRRGRRAFAMHDPLATAIALDPSVMLDAPELPVTVETNGTWTRGMTIADRRPGKPEVVPPGRATVCFKPDAERFFESYCSVLEG